MGNKFGLRDLWMLVLALVLGLGVRCAWYSYAYGPDGKRFVRQAHELLHGEGFLFDTATPTTKLPPGYPVLLGVVFLVWDDPFAVVPLQFLLSLASIALVYLAIRPWSKRGAVLAALALALHPYLALKVAEVRSETLGVFLTSLLVFTISRIEYGGVSRSSTGLFFSVGALSLVIVLTVPGLSFLCLALWLALAIRVRTSPVRLAALTGGSLLLAIPWQWHCYHAVGHIEPLMYGRPTGITVPGPNAGVVNVNCGFGRWTRSWLTAEPQMAVWWWPGSFSRVPDDAFESPEQQSELHRLHDLALEDKADPITFDQVFGAAADRRFEKLPLQTYVEIPLLRACTLWTVMPQLHHAQMDRIPNLAPQSFLEDKAQLGTKRALLRYLKAVWSLVVYALYLAYSIGFCVLALKSWNDRRLVPLAILLGVFAYTAVSAYFALGEARRNLPLFPVLLFLLAYSRMQPRYRLFPLDSRESSPLVAEYATASEPAPADNWRSK